MNQNARMQRALQQRMFLISAQEVSSNNWKFVIEGSRGINYTLQFTEKGMFCTCPDYLQRRKICKHMFFVLGRVAQLQLVEIDNHINVYEIYKNLNENLRRTLSQRMKETTTLVSSDDCCICFESMESGKLIKCQNCQNTMHNDCIVIWLSNSCRKNCPLCRTVWITTEDALSKFESTSKQSDPIE